jgi:Ca2+-binding RTX toxin-like protein
MSVMAQRFAADGERLGGEVKLSEGSQDLHIRPKVIELSDGVISVSWQSYDRANFKGQLESKILLTPDLGSDGNDILTGTRYDDRLDALAGNDKLLGQGGNDRLKGGVGDDILKGQSGADHLLGGAGLDRLFGGEKTDRLLGGKGADALFGGGGKDYLNGNTGNDIMVGGAGEDTFVFSKGHDTIADFSDDLLKLDNSLWQNNDLSVNQVMQFAQVSNGNLVFDFANGNTLTLTGYTDTSALEAAIIIF